MRDTAQRLAAQIDLLRWLRDNPEKCTPDEVAKLVQQHERVWQDLYYHSYIRSAA